MCTTNSNMFASILCVCFYLTAVLSTRDERIIGGRPAKPGEIPYIVSLRHNGKHICGGSILNKRHVLTAAHCVYTFFGEPDPSEYQVQYGVVNINSKYNIVPVKKIIIHEDHFRILFSSYSSDIAILTLDGHIVFGRKVKPTILPSIAPNISGDSITATLSGWGYTENGTVNYLRTVKIPLFNDHICAKYIHPIIPILNIFGYNPQYHLCAGDLDGSHGGCFGDSGSPLYADGVQHGITSYGSYSCRNSPVVFTKVGHYVNWIRKNIY